MVRRVGFNHAKTAGPEAVRADPQERGGAPVRPPKVRRNWTRIVIQSFWVDLWLIGTFKAAENIFESVIRADGPLTVPAFSLLCITLLGAILSVRKLLRLLRGKPAAPAES